MFPRGLIIFIIILVFDIISKSVKDKKKIEKSRKKRQEKLNRNVSTAKRPFKESEKRKVDLPTAKRSERLPSVSSSSEYTVETKERATESFDRRTIKENYVDTSYQIRDEITKESIKEGNRTNLSKKKNRIRKDILKGVIFSELLSEPKSIKNMKRSI